MHKDDGNMVGMVIQRVEAGNDVTWLRLLCLVSRILVHKVPKIPLV